MKSFLLFFIGLFAGLWVAWPGIFILNNWKCFRGVIHKAKKDEVSLKVALAISPDYFLKGKNNNNSSKLRLVSDACFR